MRKPKANVRQRAYVENDESFLRSKTISSYDPSNDYQEKTIELKHLKEQKKITRKKQRRIAILCLCVLAGLSVFAFSQMTAIILDVEYNNSTINREQDDEYLELANKYLTEHPAERVSWSRKDNSLSSYMQSLYPEISNVEIRGGFGVGKLYIEIRRPIAVWKTSSQNNFVDQEGAVFTKNYYQDPNIIIEDKSNSGIISQRFLEFIGKIIAGVNINNIEQVEKVIIPEDSIRYVEITLVNHNYPIKIQTDRDTDSQVEDIVNMISYLTENNIEPSYVDVRVKNRGFWR